MDRSADSSQLRRVRATAAIHMWAAPVHGRPPAITENPRYSQEVSESQDMFTDVLANVLSSMPNLGKRRGPELRYLIFMNMRLGGWDSRCLRIQRAGKQIPWLASVDCALSNLDRPLPLHMKPVQCVVGISFASTTVLTYGIINHNPTVHLGSTDGHLTHRQNRLHLWKKGCAGELQDFNINHWSPGDAMHSHLNFRVSWSSLDGSLLDKSSAVTSRSSAQKPASTFQ